MDGISLWPKYPMSCSFKIYMVMGVYEWLLAFSCTFRSTFRRDVSFGNKIDVPNYPQSCNFNINMARRVYLQNLWSGCLFFPAPSEVPSGGRCPLEMKYTYPSSLCHVVSEYIWLGWYISKTLGVRACYFPAPSGAPSGARCPLEMKYTYPITLSHVISK